MGSIDLIFLSDLEIYHFECSLSFKEGSHHQHTVSGRNVVVSLILGRQAGGQDRQGRQAMALIIFYFQMMSCAVAGREREAVSGSQQGRLDHRLAHCRLAGWTDSVEKVTAE